MKNHSFRTTKKQKCRENITQVAELENVMSSAVTTLTSNRGKKRHGSQSYYDSQNHILP